MSVTKEFLLTDQSYVPYSTAVPLVFSYVSTLSVSSALKGVTLVCS